MSNSLVQNQWRIKEQAPESFEKKFPEFSRIIRELLWQRGLRTQKAIDEFFNPDYSSDIHNPLLLKNAKKAVRRIFEALKRKERVLVYGDYDADGVSGAVIFYNALQGIGFKKENLGVYLPDREKEGYGLNNGAVEKFIKDKYNLIVTIDCGTTNHEQIALAKKNGIDTIVLDHHRVIDKPPKCYAFVNAHQDGETYPFEDLCGAGVAFKIACALFDEARSKRAVRSSERYDGKINPLRDSASPKKTKQKVIQIKSPLKGQEKWFLDLVALATVTDVMPLIGENRTLVKYGLFVLSQAKRPGFRALMDVSGVKPKFSQANLSTNLSPFTLGFVLGPRINAAGRMDHANTAFALLNADSYDEALEYARNIDEKNKERQRLVSNILNQIERRMAKTRKAGSDPISRGFPSRIIFEGDESWPIGVLGVVAGRLVGKYYKPSFIYQIKKDGNVAGSVRTIPGFHVVHALESVQDILVNFGGHPQAGGFTVPQEKLEEMKERILEFAKKNLKKEDFVKKTEYSIELAPEDISWETYEEIARFEPFGEANREPIFLLKGANIATMDKVGKDNGNGKSHVRFFLDISGAKKKAMGFGMAGRAEKLKVGDSIDILFSFAIDEWNGNRELMLRLVDLKKL